MRVSRATMEAEELFRAEYRPCAILYEDADALEYVTKDVAHIYEHINGDLAIVRDITTREIMGFRLDRWSINSCPSIRVHPRPEL